VHETLDAQLHAAGLKSTARRREVLEALDDVPHSDAESLTRGMRERHPGLTVQSVHNVLADLTRAGLLRRIEPAGSPARYERRTGDNHHHVVCTDCGTIADIDCVTGDAPCLTPGDAAGFSVVTAEVTFWGLCAKCAASPGPTTFVAPVPAP